MTEVGGENQSVPEQSATTPTEASNRFVSAAKKGITEGIIASKLLTLVSGAFEATQGEYKKTAALIGVSAVLGGLQSVVESRRS